MKIVLHDQHQNDYLTKVFWDPLIAYGRNHALPIHPVKTTDDVRDSVVILHGDCASPDRILRLKNCGNKLVIFDINDSSYFSSSYIHSPEQDLLDLIFKVSGVPKQNEVNELNLDRNFQIQVSREKYLPDDKWEQFDKIRQSGRIKPLPYALWHPLVPHGTPNRPWNHRSGKVLLRGGNHFWRVILAYRLMQEGMLDSRSQFATAAYFKPEMERRFQYCDGCRLEKAQHGRSLYDAPLRTKDCTNPSTCWHLPGEFFGGPMYGKHEHGYWNNRCPHSFLHLAKEYERCRGPLDKDFLERLLNGDMQHENDFVEDLSQAAFYGDLKWLNTINLPPRFWEAASVGTVSYYTARTADQDYWPHVTEGEHYLTYPEDMGSFDIRDISPDRYHGISNAIKDLYETKMRGTEYAISNSLLDYMSQSIRELL